MSLGKDWQGKTQGNFRIEILCWFFKFFPLSFGYYILWIVIPFYLIFARKGYKSINNYFRQRLNLTPIKSFLKTFNNHYIFGKVILDRIALFAGKKNVFRVTVHGNDILKKLLDEKKGGIILSSHIGNFEIAGYLFNFENVKMHGLIFGEENQTWLKYRNEALSNHNIHLIPVKSDLSHIFLIRDVLNNGDIVGIPGDRSFHGTRVHTCNFLGKAASFPTGAFNMAEKLNIPAISFFVMKSGSFSYDIYINNISGNTIEKRVGNYVATMEEILLKFPEQWFNFYDFWNDMKNK